jgi:hypothetical protein
MTRMPRVAISGHGRHESEQQVMTDWSTAQQTEGAACAHREALIALTIGTARGDFPDSAAPTRPRRHLHGGTATDRVQETSALDSPLGDRELALGTLADRDAILGLLGNQPHAVVANDDEILHLIGSHALDGSGIGYVDAQLLAATCSPRTRAYGLGTDGWQVSTRLGVLADVPRTK